METLLSQHSEIRDALQKASMQHEWDTDGRFIQWKDGHPLKGTYRQIAITDASWAGGISFANENHENDANLIVNAPKWLQHLLDENDRQAKEIEKLREIQRILVLKGADSQ